MNDLTFKNALLEFKTKNSELKNNLKNNDNQLTDKIHKKMLKETSKLSNTSKTQLKQYDKQQYKRDSNSITSNSYGEFIKRVNNLSPNNNVSRGKLNSKEKKNREALTLFIGGGDYGLDHHLKNNESTNNTHILEANPKKPKLYEKKSSKKKSTGLLKHVPSSSKMNQTSKGHSMLYDANASEHTWFNSPKNNSISINLHNPKQSTSFLRNSKNKQLNGIKRKIMGKAIGIFFLLIICRKQKERQFAVKSEFKTGVFPY